MKVRVHKSPNGRVVLVATSEGGVTAVLQIPRQEVASLCEQLMEKRELKADADWQDIEWGTTPESELRYQAVGQARGVQLTLGGADDVRAYATMDEDTSGRLHRELGVHVERLGTGVLTPLGDDAREGAVPV